jgi:hypothetical protein
VNNAGCAMVHYSSFIPPSFSILMQIFRQFCLLPNIDRLTHKIVMMFFVIVIRLFDDISKRRENLFFIAFNYWLMPVAAVAIS